MRRAFIVLACCMVLVLGGAAALYRFALPGLSSARPAPPAVETAVAAWLLHHSVPEAAHKQRNPLGADAADTVAGRDLFREKCEICHGYDGSGRTQIGAGEYPHPPPLRQLAAALTDGEIFYHIRNGIRNTGMPAWNLPERQIWQIVLYIRHLPITVPMSSRAATGTPLHVAFSLAPQPATAAESSEKTGLAAGWHYVGSAACKSCHENIYERWRKTPMANVVTDPRENPNVIIPDLLKPDPLVTFTKSDIAFVYGHIWKQRYFKKVGGDYFVEPAQWDVMHKVWRKYVVEPGEDWWATLYPPDNFQRPTGPLCDGCHSVNYDVNIKMPTEWNVGCEKCHGPGSEHVKQKTRETIINPARLDYVHANDTCIQCHSQGRPPTNPINGKYYDWPVGFHMGLTLSDFWKLEDYKLGQPIDFYYFPDGTAHKNRMQGNDFVQALMYRRGVACFSCHDVHGTANDAQLRAPPGDICFTCHGTNTQNGPHTVTIEEHTHHKPGSTGSQCIACHMPKIEKEISDVMVHAHTFNFITPADTEKYGIPNPCNICHKDKSTAWAAEALKSWKDVSPWRMQQ